ncbi:MAG: amino acid racemase [Caldilinea sp. CFX5]|nr:amino acid racemase [Caldilinea sp. CFX5]
MKRIGILGGISHESTAVYYQRLHSEYFARRQDYYYPEVIVYSLNFQRFTDYEDRGEMGPYVEYILQGMDALQQAGADFALMAANSPHAVFPQVAAQTALPLLSIVEVTARAAQARGLRRLLLLGIRFTMQATFYADVCVRYGIDVITPDADEQEIINRIIFEELVVGTFRAESRQLLLRIIEQYPVDGVILGCTELPLILRSTDTTIPLLDTLTLHVNAAIDYALR